ncbi:NADH-ubiquinone oxidoreductase-F iron-sulfur binding region domain-containing protein [Chloroflexota bacterium]
MQNYRTIFVCQGTGCVSSGSNAIYEALKVEVSNHGVQDVKVDLTGCHGFCEQGPNVVVEPEGIFYTHVQVEDTREIIISHLRDGNPVERLFYHDPITNKAIQYYSEINFYKKQQRVVLSNCGRINPEKIDQYIAQGGYRAAKKVLLEMTPEQVIEEVTKSGLKGRGGAGFPTGRKWEFCHNATGDEKYIICNADEGDPGAFMDRSILEADPHAVIEGMIIAGYAIGTSEGYIYARTEYPLAIKRINIALEQAQENNYLGNNILSSDFNFMIHVKEGAGAFVCGEETALIASIESQRGMPRPRPPFPAQSGLDGKPTTINNVKSLASIPIIIDRGAEWYSSIGTETSKGTAIFALTGKVNNSGLVEVPMGTLLSTIIFDIGGGISRDKRFKAVQTGGPSGGCIPIQFLDSPVEYETLAKLGSIIGSGGMVVMDESTCMVEIARYFLSFTQDESCGKCAPCRLGTRQMLEILTRITQGRGRQDDLNTLDTIARTVKEGSLCGLGQTCPNPVLTTLNYFRDEYESHITERKCPAAVCDALMISPCQHTCPVGINVPKYVAHIASGEYLEAVNTIRERNPFPAICGRICHHPCERRCRRGELDEPVDIRALKRFAADWYFDHASELPDPEPFPQTHSEKVAIVGAGPTGLACAYFLAQMGYPTTVFEALPVGGGMLSVAIPEFRLPSEVIQSEINYIAKRGVEIKYDTPINTNFTIEDLKNNGFEAVFIGAGAQRSQSIGIPGEIDDITNFYYGLRFLRDVKTGKPVSVGQRVVIIGGGNVALDTARTALRLGAKEATIYYRRSRDEMLVTEVEYDEAIAEGIQINFLVSPTRITSQNWTVTGLQCTRMTLGELDPSGRRRPVPVVDSDFFVEADTIIAAVGQAPDLSFLPADSALERTRWETLVVNDNTLVTNIPGIFAGGDFATGPGMVIDAIAAGRRGAIAIDKYFKGDSSPVHMYDTGVVDIEEVSPIDETEDIWEERPRLPVATLPVAKRRQSFQEIELSFTEEQAREAARRCLRCDLEIQ